MPQLNTSPWFLVLLLTWTVLLLMFLNKTTNSKHMSNPTQKDVKEEISQPWTWPWF